MWIGQVDADRLAWAYANLGNPISYCEQGIMRNLQRLKVAAGCDKLNLHVTLGNKGGREVVATIKPYQGNRKGKVDKEKTDMINLLRHYIGDIRTNDMVGIKWLNQEADDGICQVQSLSDKSIVISDDKDLRMIRGWHYDRKAEVRFLVKDFGKVLRKENKTKTLWGVGTCFFWHQMLMGDAVDNIPGLEKMSVDTVNEFFPIKSKKRNPKLCGQVSAMKLLDGLKTDLECFERVLGCYKSYYEHGEERFFEQSVLLWMRRNDNIFDVLDFLEPLGFKYKPPQELVDKVKEWL